MVVKAPMLMSEHLPEEVILQILRRLPIKTIVRCTSICKFWTNEGVPAKRVIMVFDLRDEAYHEIMLPQHECYWILRLCAFGESSIAVFHEKSVYLTDIWVMKEYGTAASWMMLGTVGKVWRGKSMVLGFRNNGDVLLQFYRNHNIASQNIKSQRVKVLSSIADCNYEIHSYEESLALIGKGNDASPAATSGPSNAKRIKISN